MFLKVGWVFLEKQPPAPVYHLLMIGQNRVLWAWPLLQSQSCVRTRFQYSTNTEWTTSRQAGDICWISNLVNIKSLSSEWLILPLYHKCEYKQETCNSSKSKSSLNAEKFPLWISHHYINYHCWSIYVAF